MSPVELTYRKTAAASGATGLELLIALYDTLAGSLRRAAEAERRNRLEQRCREVNHALMVVGLLEDWLSRGSGGTLAQQLASFYRTLRRKLIEAQSRRSPQILEQQMERVLEIRSQLQAFDFQRAPSGPEILAPAPSQSYGALPPLQSEMEHLSWSA